jgi:hypothetical protein
MIIIPSILHFTQESGLDLDYNGSYPQSLAEQSSITLAYLW